MYSKTILTIILCAGFVAAKTQTINYSRNMEATIVATEHFEESRVTLIHLADSLHCMLMSLNEEKDGSKPVIFDMEFYTDEAGFNHIDKQLVSLGHVAFKKAGLTNMFILSDTLSLQQKIDENRSTIASIEKRLATGEGEYNDLLNNLELLKAENREFELQIQRSRLLSPFPHHVVIHLRS